MYIGRGSKFGNPFSLYTGEYTLEESLFNFEYETSKRLILEKDFRADVLSLRGKKLGCSCKKCRSDQPAFAFDETPCHGEFFANFLNSLEGLV